MFSKHSNMNFIFLRQLQKLFIWNSLKFLTFYKGSSESIDYKENVTQKLNFISGWVKMIACIKLFKKCFKFFFPRLVKPLPHMPSLASSNSAANIDKK